jgi:hypothetical protein
MPDPSTSSQTQPPDPWAYGLQYPELGPQIGQRPSMPSQWSATMLLHPFSPPPAGEGQPEVPFFQLCTATVSCSAGSFFSAQITGCEYGEWWYWVDQKGTHLSVDGGKSWTSVLDSGWALPAPANSWFGGQDKQAACAGSSYLNWMKAQQVAWWKIPVAGSKAATWMWFDGETGHPFRLMYGQPPRTPLTGTPDQLPVLQMFSFTYVTAFEVGPGLEPPSEWEPSAIPGFTPGNPDGLQLVTWNENFGMTAFMTPANESFNPLPTRILYRWAEDSDYHLLSDRAQNTRMSYMYNAGYNPNKVDYENVLMFGPAPASVEAPAESGESFDVFYHPNDPTPDCHRICVEGEPLAEEPPGWASSKGTDGAIHAVIVENPDLCPGHTVAVIGELFPPSDEYPQGRYLWTWYSPIDAGGTAGPGSHARPVTFMESGSEIGVGTSLALADYWDYREFKRGTIDPRAFAVPDQCLKQPRCN